MSTRVENNKSLSPDDYKLIENEHKLLDRFLADLRDTCCNLDNQLDCSICSKERLASCRGRFSSFLYRLLETTSTHYYHEESIMLSRLHVTEKYEYFRAHRQAHIDIIEELRVIADECGSLNQQGRTADGYRQLYNKISNLFAEHDSSFDTPFIQSTHQA